MAWTNPITRAVDDIYTAAQWNTHIRDNLDFLHTVHGPLWIPASRWTREDGIDTNFDVRGTEPDHYTAWVWGLSAAYWVHATVLVPDDWISGGFTVKLHYAPASAFTANDMLHQFDYAFIASGESMVGAGTAIDTTQAIDATANYKVVTLGTTSAPTAGDLMRLATRRDGVPAGDTYGANIDFLGIELEYT